MDFERLFSVRDKTVIVTGGSRGIGFMIATGFVQAGAKVYICARKAAACDAAADDLRRLGRCISIPADLSTVVGVEDFAAKVASVEERVHVLVNNAGVTWGAPLEEYPYAAFDKVMSVNVKGVFHLTRLLLPQLRAAASEEDPARVINIGSVDGIQVPIWNNYAYTASKAAVHMLTRHLARDLIADHINVNAIAPGFFLSAMTSFVLGTPEEEKLIDATVPMKRTGKPEDIAGTAIYLASVASSYLTGVVIPVAGGQTTVN